MNDPTPSALSRRVDQVSFGIFLTVAVVAIPLLLYLGRDQWFFLDEWWILGDGAESRDGWFEAHNGHWITANYVVYRVNYELWGLHTYIPYQLPVVLLHVGSAVLLCLLMRRMGIRTWIAAAAAMIFLFFGSGSINIFYGFQMSLTGSLFCGLALFLLADHDGPFDKRDWFALGVGVVGLMTSAVFVPLVVGAVMAILLHRGPRIATFYAVPLGLIFSVWYVLYGRDGTTDDARSSPRQTIRFVDRILRETFTSLAQNDVVAIVLAVLALITIAVAVGAAFRTRQWAQLSIPAGLVSALLASATVTGVFRGYLPDELGDLGRYVSISAALILPIVALGAEYLARKNAFAGLIPIGLLAVGLPGNVDALANQNPYRVGDPNGLTTLAHSEYIDDVPAEREPWADGSFAVPLTAGWLSDEAKAGNIPEPTTTTAESRLRAYGRLALEQQGEGNDNRECPLAAQQPVEVELSKGDRVRFEGNILVFLQDGQVRSSPFLFQSSEGSALVAELGPLDLLVNGVGAGQKPRLCDPRAKA